MFKMFELRRERGFSLVELMIVVAIIAILAAIAIPSFMRFAMKSKTSEATGNLSAIRTCQESFRAEEDEYQACAENPGLGTLGASPRPWIANADFDLTGFEPDGDVRYSYRVDYLLAAPNTFTAEATGDLDDDGNDATFTITKGVPGYPKAVKGGDDF